MKLVFITGKKGKVYGRFIPEYIISSLAVLTAGEDGGCHVTCGTLEIEKNRLYVHAMKLPEHSDRIKKAFRRAPGKSIEETCWTGFQGP